MSITEIIALLGGIGGLVTGLAAIWIQSRQIKSSDKSLEGQLKLQERQLDMQEEDKEDRQPSEVIDRTARLMQLQDGVISQLKVRLDQVEQDLDREKKEREQLESMLEGKCASITAEFDSWKVEIKALLDAIEKALVEKKTDEALASVRDFRNRRKV